MLGRIEYVIEMLFKAKKDKRTYVLSIGCLVAFGVAVGAVAVYESMLRELDDQGIRPYNPMHHSYRDDDEEDY